MEYHSKLFELKSHRYLFIFKSLLLASLTIMVIESYFTASKVILKEREKKKKKKKKRKEKGKKRGKDADVNGREMQLMTSQRSGEAKRILKVNIFSFFFFFFFYTRKHTYIFEAQ